MCFQFRLWLLATVLAAAACTAGTPALPPAGTEAAPPVPEPPRQRQSWIPPATTLPKELLDATATLFAQGLADPRGCEYRAVEVNAGDSGRGTVTRVRTQGWVLPGREGERRFAVCWNGLVTPVKTVGAPAELREAVRAAVEPWERRKREDPDFRLLVFGPEPTPEAEAIAAHAADRLRTCLLLRLGEESLARRMWEASPERTGTVDRGPYLELAADWLWHQFDRTLAAHLRGDDLQALAGARQLVASRAAVLAETARPGAPRLDAAPPILDFGTSPEALLADQERRAQSASRPAPDGSAEDLVRRLDDLREPHPFVFVSGGRVEPGVMPELIARGEAVVPALIDCLEHPERLTRVSRRHRFEGRYREVEAVPRFALEALSAILKTRLPGSDPYPREWAKTAAAYRDYWKRYGALSLPERWYRVLQDDTANAEAWLEAASLATLPAAEELGVYAELRTESAGTGGERGRPGRLHGEPLRERASPSVTALLRRRVTELSAGITGTHEHENELAVQLAIRLAAWDPRAGRAVLRSEFQRMVALGQRSPAPVPGPYGPDEVGRHLVALTYARHRADDADALREYTRWLLSDPAHSRVNYPARLLEPIWRYPDDPAVTAAARALFRERRSPWRARFEAAAATLDHESTLLQSPLLGLGPFRGLVEQLLARRTPIGKASRKDERVWVSVGSGPAPHILEFEAEADLRAIAPGELTAVRLCDLLAWRLSELNGAPEFSLFWKQDDREAALGRMRAFLRKYGPSIRSTSRYPDGTGRFYDARASITFPRLNRPATAADVQAGRAIFSLGKSRQVRTVPPGGPQRARWKALKKYASTIRELDEKNGEVKTRVIYDQDGWVWQAEEVFVKGRWERYYGFVGPHEIVKVPAGELEFE